MKLGLSFSAGANLAKTCAYIWGKTVNARFYLWYTPKVIYMHSSFKKNSTISQTWFINAFNYSFSLDYSTNLKKYNKIINYVICEKIEIIKTQLKIPLYCAGESSKPWQSVRCSVGFRSHPKIIQVTTVLWIDRIFKILNISDYTPVYGFVQCVLYFPLLINKIYHRFPTLVSQQNVPVRKNDILLLIILWLKPDSSNLVTMYLIVKISFITTSNIKYTLNKESK